MDASTNQRDDRFDFMRGIAILFVLLIHAFSGQESTSGAGLAVSWLLTFTRPCIAIFLFVSGYFFRLNADRHYLAERIKRVAIPYLIFSLLALLYQSRLVHLPEMVRQRPLLILQNLLIGNTWGVYWFIPVILVTYVLGFALLRGDKSRVLWVTLVFLAINLLHAAYYDAAVARFQLQDNNLVWLYSYRFFITWPFYFFLGALFRAYNLRDFLLEHRRETIALWAVVFAVYNGLFFLGVVPGGGYNSIADTLAAVTAIGALMVAAVPVPALSFLGRYSYPIYLAHYFFVSFARRVAETLFGSQPLWFSVVVMLFSLAGSVALVWLSQRLLGRRAKVLLAA